MSDFDDIIQRLRSVSDDLADRAIAILSEASRAGESKRPDAERVVTQARRAVEKAIVLLERADER
jgi:N-acetylmuramic acid 6-phosphate (MurNAc-6-P) etherase